MRFPVMFRRLYGEVVGVFLSDYWDMARVYAPGRGIIGSCQVTTMLQMPRVTERCYAPVLQEMQERGYPVYVDERRQRQLDRRAQ